MLLFSWKHVSSLNKTHRNEYYFHFLKDTKTKPIPEFSIKQLSNLKLQLLIFLFSYLNKTV